jgi:DNA (cytosine-5)-methyltransferase 1
MNTNSHEEISLSFGSLFSGVGGLDLGLEQAGLKCTFQVENDKHCLTILARHWPDVPKNEIRPCMGLVGGDPCPIRSSASFLRGTIKPDLSGYFLAMVARCKPRWILRENVPAPDVHDFSIALVMLGYRCVIVEADSAAFTGQSRRREFVAGFDKQDALDLFMRACSESEGNLRGGETGLSKIRSKLFCLSTRRNRMDHRSHYVWEGPERGLRLLSHAERESLQGFPPGWTDGIPQSARERAVGNAVTVPVVKWLGERIREILKYEEHEETRRNL